MTSSNEQRDQLFHYQRLLLEESTATLTYVKAIVAVAIGADFQQYEIPVIHDYLGGIYSLLEKLEEFQQQLTRTFYSMPMLCAEEEGNTDG